jgi:hypothetical protein
MKSDRALVVIALLALTLAFVSSAVLWDTIGSAVKIGMFAFGFGSGVAVGALLARRSIRSLS